MIEWSFSIVHVHSFTYIHLQLRTDACCLLSSCKKHEVLNPAPIELYPGLVDALWLWMPCGCLVSAFCTLYSVFRLRRSMTRALVRWFRQCGFVNVGNICLVKQEGGECFLCRGCVLPNVYGSPNEMQPSPQTEYFCGTLGWLEPLVTARMQVTFTA